ncbi:unnamed protein product [Rhizopus stolonifer]
MNNSMDSELLEAAHKDYDVTPYLEITAEWNKDDKAYLKRYYTLYYKDDIYVRQSPNKICVLGLRQPSDIKEIKFKTELIGEKCVLIWRASCSNYIRNWLRHQLVDHSTFGFGFIAVVMPKYEDSSIQLAGYEIQP